MYNEHIFSIFFFMYFAFHDNSVLRKMHVFPVYNGLLLVQMVQLSQGKRGLENVWLEWEQLYKHKHPG